MENERFDKLFLLYSKDVYRLAYSYVLNKLDAEDIVQRSYYKLYKNIKKLSIPDIEIKKWLFKVAINEAKDILRSLNFKISKYSIKEVEIPESKKESESFILQDIAKNYRIPLYLYYYEGYSIKEISKITNKSESAVKMCLARGRDQLKEKWSDKFEKN